jgi:hypothetical protein
MIKIDEYQRVCRLAKLVEVKDSKTCLFKTFNGIECIELIAGKLVGSAIITMKDGTKEKVVADLIESKEIISVIGAFEKGVRSIEEPKPGEQKPEESKKEIVINPLNAIPDILEEKRIITPSDIEAWKKLSTFERILLFQKTAKGLVKQRRGYLLPEFAGKDKKTLTNDHFKMFNYLDGNVMKHSANIAFLFEWSCVVESEKYFENEVCIRGYIQVEINGKMYRRACGGSGIKKGMMDWGDTMESAITEMTKRGIYHFLHGDVKRGDFNEIN